MSGRRPAAPLAFQNELETVNWTPDFFQSDADSQQANRERIQTSIKGVKDAEGVSHSIDHIHR